ncbi:MAG: peptidylprolyl isomerase [Myxococcales bacterium]|nr:peptidylprolyl isomerase [Myxococcales bacterium]
MSRVATVATVLCLLAACPSPSGPVNPTTPPPADDVQLRIQVARLEVKREDGIRELAELATGSDRRARELAIRGLGRIGGKARATLRPLLADPDARIVAVTMAALGIARELDDLTVAEGEALVGELQRAYGRTTGADRILAIEALGRAGDERSQPLLVEELGKGGAVAEAAGIALARHGRRKISLAPRTVHAVAVALGSADARTRWGATYALARAVMIAKPESELTSGLAARVGDESAEIRALACAALAKHGAVAQTTFQLEKALLDRDWHVAVEAVRAMTGDRVPAEAADAVATALVRRLADLDLGAASEAHVIMEGLRGLARSAGRPVVAKALQAISQWSQMTTKPAELTRSWIECLAAVGAARAANTLAPVVECSARRLPDHLRMPLLAQLVTAGIGSAQERRTTLLNLMSHSDVRVKSSALGALTAGWATQSEADRRAAVGILVGALASPDPIFAGNAVDAVGGFYEAIGKGDHAALDAALVARAGSEKDAELSAALFEAIGAHKIAAGADACRAGLDGIPVRAKAARGCLAALGEAAPPGDTRTHAPPPPVDVATVIGKPIEWRLATSRGEIVIELRPDVAPWAVASVVALTQAGKYDGLALHRVVPDFVAQGGDPTESGWGGPGYTLPAEPASSADGPGFVAGGVGMADAGRDSAGSQWFVMHARAAHLDGRYTWIGSLESGQKSADALLIGDVVRKATITGP